MKRLFAPARWSARITDSGSGSGNDATSVPERGLTPSDTAVLIGSPDRATSSRAWRERRAERPARWQLVSGLACAADRGTAVRASPADNATAIRVMVMRLFMVALLGSGGARPKRLQLVAGSCSAGVWMGVRPNFFRVLPPRRRNRPRAAALTRVLPIRSGGVRDEGGPAPRAVRAGADVEILTATAYGKGPPPGECQCAVRGPRVLFGVHRFHRLCISGVHRVYVDAPRGRVALAIGRSVLRLARS